MRDRSGIDAPVKERLPSTNVREVIIESYKEHALGIIDEYKFTGIFSIFHEDFTDMLTNLDNDKRLTVADKNEIRSAIISDLLLLIQDIVEEKKGIKNLLLSLFR